MENIINLPVSLGEALDKLTILDIKKDKIKDDRLKDVKKEYDILFNKLKKYIKKYDFYYIILKKINEEIWDMQDEFRDNINSKKNELCLKIIEENDRRFRIKMKINNLTKSYLKEQKGYNPKKAFVLTHLGLGDNITSIGMVRYLSTCYDEVLVVCKTHNKKNLELIYSDDTSIKIYDVENDKNISPRFGYNQELFKKQTKDYDLYLCGLHNLYMKYCDYKKLPFCFYEQMNIDSNIFWEYFYISNIKEGINLYNKIGGIEYIFVHNTSSEGEVFDIKLIETKLKLSKKEILFINPNKNFYELDEEYYNIAKKFIGYNLPLYIEIIKNSKYNILCDSSFMCMAINLDIKTDKNYYISRNNSSYDFIYSNDYIFKNLKRKKFIDLLKI